MQNVRAKELPHVRLSTNEFPWTALIAGHVQQGQHQDALNSFERMQNEGLYPDVFSVACSSKSTWQVQVCDDTTRQMILFVQCHGGYESKLRFAHRSTKCSRSSTNHRTS